MGTRTILKVFAINLEQCKHRTFSTVLLQLGPTLKTWALCWAAAPPRASSQLVPGVTFKSTPEGSVELTCGQTGTGVPLVLLTCQGDPVTQGVERETHRWKGECVGARFLLTGVARQARWRPVTSQCSQGCLRRTFAPSIELFMTQNDLAKVGVGSPRGQHDVCGLRLRAPAACSLPTGYPWLPWEELARHNLQVQKSQDRNSFSLDSAAARPRFVFCFKTPLAGGTINTLQESSCLNKFSYTLIK